MQFKLGASFLAFSRAARPLSVAALLVALAVPVRAQRSWVRTTPSTSPGPRDSVGLAYDTSRAKLVLFGGGDASGNPFSDTWESDGTTWTRINTTATPQARSACRLAYDSSRARSVLFGGYSNGYLNDTWEWDGTTWSLKSPTSTPTACYSPGLAYDEARNKTVLFGGVSNNSVMLSDTWLWDGTSWTRANPATKPPARGDCQLAYDSVRQVMVLFGGTGANGPLSDTWEWDGTHWTQLFPAQSPPSRERCTLTFDTQRSRTVLFGGNLCCGGGVLNDVWEWDGTDWTQVVATNSPPARQYSDAAALPGGPRLPQARLRLDARAHGALRRLRQREPPPVGHVGLGRHALDSRSSGDRSLAAQQLHVHV